MIAGDLARELGVSTARVAALLKAMEKNGLATRCFGPVLGWSAGETVRQVSAAERFPVMITPYYLCRAALYPRIINYRYLAGRGLMRSLITAGR